MSFLQQLKALFQSSKYVFLSNIRTPEILFFGLAFPIIFISIFGSLGGGEASFEVAMRPDSLTDSPIAEVLNNFEAIKITQDRTNEQIDEDLRLGRLAAAITIIDSPDPGSLQTVKLETSLATPQNSSSITTIIKTMVDSINHPPEQTEFQVINLQTIEVEGRKYSQIDFILPGQLSFALLSVGVSGTAFSFITLRKTLVLKRMFATPSPRWVILGSKILSTMVMSVMQAVLIISVGYFFFEFTLVNGWQTFGEMLLLSVLGLLVFLGLGLMVASLSKTEDSASPIANIITLPQFILSGAFFPIDFFPEYLKMIANILPMTFLNNAMRAVAFEGVGLSGITSEIGWLLVWAVAVYAVTVKMFKWE